MDFPDHRHVRFDLLNCFNSRQGGMGDGCEDDGFAKDFIVGPTPRRSHSFRHPEAIHKTWLHDYCRTKETH
jgi:hypothetical protein